MDTNRMGITNLRQAMSDDLTKMYLDWWARRLDHADTDLIRLPKIKEKASLKMKEVQNNLDNLPQSFSDNPQEKLLAIVNQFHSEVDEWTNTKCQQASLAVRCIWVNICNFHLNSRSHNPRLK